MWQCSPLIAKCVRLKIVDTLLTLTLITSKQPVYTQSLYATNHIQIIDIQYCVCKYYRLHPGVLLPLYFKWTAFHTVWVRYDVALSHSSAFGWQFAACRSFHQFLVNIARLPHLALSSFFSSISMTYHKQYQISQPCAQGLSGGLCSWIHGWIRYDHHSWDRFVLNTDRSFYDTYDITHFNFVSIFRH